jgi:hypothetical protein
LLENAVESRSLIQLRPPIPIEDSSEVSILEGAPKYLFQASERFRTILFDPFEQFDPVVVEDLRSLNDELPVFGRTGRWAIARRKRVLCTPQTTPA